MPLATSTDHGKDLPSVQLLIKKNQVNNRLISGFEAIKKVFTFDPLNNLFHFLFLCLIDLPQTLQKEIQGHQPRINDIQAHGRTMSPGKESEMDRERRAALDERLAELRELWALLISETEKRNMRLEEANRAQQFYADAAEAEAWMGEQELHMMSEEKAKVSELCMCL